MFSGDAERNQLYKMANAGVKYKLSLLISVTHDSEEKKNILYNAYWIENPIFDLSYW